MLQLSLSNAACALFKYWFDYLYSVTCKVKQYCELAILSAFLKTGDVSTYDAIFKRPEGYNKNLHRCDREHAKSRGLNVNEEVTLW